MITYLGPLDGAAPAAIDLRAEAVAEHLAKKQGVGVAAPSERPTVALLNRLHAAGQLHLQPADPRTGGDLELAYVSSAKLIALLLDEQPGVVTALGSRARRAIRATQGALLTFPAAPGHGSVDVFTTDWSPCAAACALAVHPLHRFVADCPAVRLTGSAFTGRYVRHPLTGDLLPVWSADWVKAGFGTGAVLVNPAHDATDLAFAQEVGLPIRFSLIPDDASDEPGWWPQPPVIKTGQVVRAGPYDGLSPEAAQRTYLEVLEARGLARQTTDRALPPVPIARLQPNDAGAFAVRTGGGLLVTAGPGGLERMDVIFGSVYRCVDRAVDSRARTVVANVTAMKRVGTALVGMLADADAGPEATDFVTTGPAECPVQNVPVHTLKTALLVGGGISETVVVNRQLVDQVDRFYDCLARCRTELPDGPAEPPREVLSFLEDGNLKRAFQALTRWQKDCLKSGRGLNKPTLEATCALFTFDRDSAPA